MRIRVLYIQVLLVIVGLSIYLVNTTLAMYLDFHPQERFQVTPTASPLANTVDSRLEYLEIDTMCSDYCWSDFVIGESDMESVFDWFAEKFPSISDYQRNHSAPNNFIGVNPGGNFAFRVFTDAQSPPMLRSFYLSIFLTNRRDQNYIGDIGLEHIEFLMPSYILSQYDSDPEFIMVKNDQNFYTILLDFKDVGVALVYRGNVENDRICLNNDITKIDWLVYSGKEISALRLLNEINQYDGIERPITVSSSDTNTMLVSNDNEIQVITGLLLSSECLNLTNYGLAD